VPASLTNTAAIGAGYIHSLAVAGDVSPFITAPLVDRTVLYGTTTWLRVGVAGSQPFTFQWKFDGTDLPGATNAVLELDNVQLDDAGRYSILASSRRT